MGCEMILRTRRKTRNTQKRHGSERDREVETWERGNKRRDKDSRNRSKIEAATPKTV